MEQFDSEFSQIRSQPSRADITRESNNSDESHFVQHLFQRICTKFLALKIDCDSSRPWKILTILLLLFQIGLRPNTVVASNGINIDSNHNQISSDQDFTFARNGSYIQIDAGREWPFNSKREISFRFKTKSPHGLLIYQTFDHNKLQREDDQDNIESTNPSNIKSSSSQRGPPLLDGMPTSDAAARLPNRKRRHLARKSVPRDGGNKNSQGRIVGDSIALVSSDTTSIRTNYGTRSSGDDNTSGESTVLSSSAISSFSASFYELYLKLENGRLKLMYEFGSRLNQTYCGKGLNDDRWHRVDLKVDPEINQMILILDQQITVEIALSMAIQQDDDIGRRNELVFTNSILYIGGLNNNASIVKNVRQRLYMAQYIGCIGQLLLRTDQHADPAGSQPATIDRMNLVRRGCINLCETNNYCLHKSTCVNYYTNSKCDCFGTGYEDIYCWQDKLTSLSMFGHSTLVYRIYDWRDRHHSNVNRFSMQFRTLVADSILFFAYGELSTQPSPKNQMNPSSQPPTINLIYNGPTLNITNLQTIQRPSPFQYQPNNNYLAVSLSNGSLVVEVNFGDQPILLSNLLYEKVHNQSKAKNASSTANHSLQNTTLSDGHWHNITFVHHYRQISLYIDEYSVNYTLPGKNNHLYFDPSVYIGSVPNFLLNETRTLLKPINLRYKYVGCMRSIYFNQQNILLALKQNSSMVEYRDILGKPNLDTCLTPEPSSLPLTLRSGKSYLTFQFLQQSHKTSQKQEPQTTSMKLSTQGILSSNELLQSNPMPKKTTRIQFEYRTSLKTYFLAGGHLRDLSYHDLGGFWTLYARDDCQLYFTMSSGLTFDPERILRLDIANKSCEPSIWYRISISLVSGDKTLNITRSRIINESFENNSAERIQENISDQGSYSLESSVELLHQIQIGGDLTKFGESSSIPFTGCVRRIVINGHSFDSRDFVTSLASPLTTGPNSIHQNFSAAAHSPLPGITQYDLISHRMAQGYVTLDSCRLVNPCSTLNPCKNSGVCRVNELGEPDCDCTKTGYVGRRCQFSIYKQSCQDLFLSGQRKSSYYLIDIDRNGPLRPIRVRCNMEDGGGHIETSVSHNLPVEYYIRRSTTNDIVLNITYLLFHHMYTHDGFYVHDDADDADRSNQELVLRSLIHQSQFCKQYFRYECRSAPLNLGNRTWMEVHYPKRHKLTSLSENDDFKCACAYSEKKCLNPSKGCNCDSNELSWTDDFIELTNHEQVGITRFVLLRYDQKNDEEFETSFPVESQSRFTLSDLKCYGTRYFGSEHEITFKTNDAYIEVPGWRRGDISFNFRTASNPPAIVLYQLATSRNHGYFRLTLMSDTKLYFEFIVNRRPRKLFLTSTHKLNNGEWQQVHIEYDSANLRLTVNDDSVMVDFDTNDHLGTFEGPLFIGGAPSKYLAGDLSKRNGFTGCFRGLRIDNRPIDLNSYLSPSMPTVISGCQPSCTENLCQNGGKCVEYWGSYECQCSNPIAHSGDNCEINLNTNSLTFVTQESYYVQHANESLIYPAYLVKNVLLNVRTYQETALVFYASDRFSNFIQLHKNGSSMVLSFNSNTTILTARLPIEDSAIVDLQPSGPSPQNPSSVPKPPHSDIPTLTLNSTTQLNLNSSSVNSNVSQQQTRVSQQTPVSSVPMKVSILESSIKISNTSGSGQPIQIKIERHRLRTTFYVNNNFIVIEKPMIFLNNSTQQISWVNPEQELVRLIKPAHKIAGKLQPRMFLAGLDDSFSTRLPGFTGCIQGFSVDNQLFDFNRAHLIGEFKGDYRIGCKMHCDSIPCKNQGVCIENWREDRIECKCDATSYIGRLCDEDVAALFNGYSSYFIYHIAGNSNGEKPSIAELANLSEEEFPNTTLSKDTVNVESDRIAHETNQNANNFIEMSLAFSSESNQSVSFERESTVQVIVFIAQANSSRHFLLGLTSDGGLLIQEDYGNSMALSRLIKKPDQPYNDGHRHMFKYTRFDQTIQIIVDHQTFLPTMSVIAGIQSNGFSKKSIIFVGTAHDNLIQTNQSEANFMLDKSYSNYIGCISNLRIKMNNRLIEPLSEAFGQNLVTINATRKKDTTPDTMPNSNDGTPIQDAETNGVTKDVKIDELQEEYTLTNSAKMDETLLGYKRLSIVDKSGRQEVVDRMETIIARDVEQGKCSSFKKVEINNGKRSVNEPKYTPLLEPRPVYMDPPRIKSYRHPVNSQPRSDLNKDFDTFFYCSAVFIIVVASSSLLYAYVLQVRYKSEKFRCDTPFFHNRRDEDNSNSLTS